MVESAEAADTCRERLGLRQGVMSLGLCQKDGGVPRYSRPIGGRWGGVEVGLDRF